MIILKIELPIFHVCRIQSEVPRGQNIQCIRERLFFPDHVDVEDTCQIILTQRTPYQVWLCSSSGLQRDLLLASARRIGVPLGIQIAVLLAWINFGFSCAMQLPLYHLNSLPCQLDTLSVFCGKYSEDLIVIVVLSTQQTLSSISCWHPFATTTCGLLFLVLQQGDCSRISIRKRGLIFPFLQGDQDPSIRVTEVPENAAKVYKVRRNLATDRF